MCILVANWNGSKTNPATEQGCYSRYFTFTVEFLDALEFYQNEILVSEVAARMGPARPLLLVAF